MSQVNVYGVDGNVKGKVSLPEAFAEPLRPDLIRKAVSVAQANRRQPYGSDRDAGKKQVAHTWGPGQGVSRTPRAVGGSQGAFAPNTRKGRRSHPPKVAKVWAEKMNRKEKAKALRSALAASSQSALVKGRGHKFKDGLSLPVVVEDKFHDIAKTSDLVEVLSKLGVAADVDRARAGTHQRAGRGKLRGRRMRTPRSLLVVAPQGSKLHLAAQNLPGVDVATPEQLNPEVVAPGGDAGRLLLITEMGLKRLAEVLA
ncbi:MAG TPA: 50S ribosomal protein L4 [Candidatus Thermoplasmatota archaeon]|nr:50S ribosomal protein L4 [Candidatus Thermoplasmatota archaeon]